MIRFKSFSDSTTQRDTVTLGDEREPLHTGAARADQVSTCQGGSCDACGVGRVGRPGSPCGLPTDPIQGAWSRGHAALEASLEQMLSTCGSMSSFPAPSSPVTGARVSPWLTCSGGMGVLGQFLYLAALVRPGEAAQILEGSLGAWGVLLVLCPSCSVSGPSLWARLWLESTLLIYLPPAPDSVSASSHFLGNCHIDHRGIWGRTSI